MHSTGLQDPTEGVDFAQCGSIMLVGIQMIEEGAGSSERSFNTQVYRVNGGVRPRRRMVGAASLGLQLRLERPKLGREWR